MVDYDEYYAQNVVIPSKKELTISVRITADIIRLFIILSRQIIGNRQTWIIGI